jgi:hypothetical protein
MVFDRKTQASGCGITCKGIAFAQQSSGPEDGDGDRTQHPQIDVSPVIQ